MDKRIVVITALFILIIVLCLDYFVREEFQIINELPYDYVAPEILAAKNTGNKGEIHVGEFKNLRSGDKIQAIKVLNRYGDEKKAPLGFDGKGPHSKDLTYYQKYSTKYPNIKENTPEPTTTHNIPSETNQSMNIPMPITSQVVSV